MPSAATTPSAPAPSPVARSPRLRRRIGAMFVLLVAANLAAWAWALIAFRDQPLLLGTALLAWGFGLRHAVDADHIAAIDNVTRKLMHAGQRPVGTGFWFAIGHSTVVVLASLAIALTTAELVNRYADWKEIGSLVGTLVSVSFLFLIAALNIVILVGVWRAFRLARKGLLPAAADFDPLLNNRGLLARLFRPLFRLVSRPWHMLPLGFLFGLGFDTASEIALLGITATQAGQGLGIWNILVFPALFTAGMALIDTADGVLMLGAYDWAFVKPVRKLYYNLVITSVSVAVALLIGGIEALGLVGDELGLEGWFWDGVGTINDNFNLLGFAIIGIFVLAWGGSFLFYRFARLDELDTAAKR